MFITITRQLSRLTSPGRYFFFFQVHLVQGTKDARDLSGVSHFVVFVATAMATGFAKRRSATQHSVRGPGVNII